MQVASDISQGDASGQQQRLQKIPLLAAHFAAEGLDLQHQRIGHFQPLRQEALQQFPFVDGVGQPAPQPEVLLNEVPAEGRVMQSQREAFGRARTGLKRTAARVGGIRGARRKQRNEFADSLLIHSGRSLARGAADDQAQMVGWMMLAGRGGRRQRLLSL
ncbi:MAG: hypothetical protein EBT61_01180 [Verrucomicrobia bacterium]|nr:hypothetical protein [Verrucomicrobiota bacterium]